MGRSVNMFFIQVEHDRGIIAQYLTPIESSDVGIAKDGDGGKTYTSKDEEIIVDLETTISLQVQNEASQSSEHCKAIEDTSQGLLDSGQSKMIQSKH